jgi:membrane protein implicated in regulation of membrane protease activity
MLGLIAIMIMTALSFNAHLLFSLAVGFSVIYILAARKYRYQRARSIEKRYYQTERPLSGMTVKEAHEVVRNLRELEFPFSMHLSMKLSLLKALLPQCLRMRSIC